MDGDPDLPPWAGLTRRGLILWSVAFAVSYALSAWAVKAFDLPGAYSPWYPPAGIMLAFLLVAGPKLLPVALLVRVTSDLLLFPEVVRYRGLTVILLRSLVVAATYAWAAWVLRRGRLDHARLPQFGWFVVIGVVAAPLLVSMGVALLDVVLLEVPSADAFEEARTFWVGDAVAIASIVPFVLLAAFAVRNGKARPHLPASLTDRVEIAGQAVALVLVPLALFALERDNSLAPFLFVAIFPVIWVALRQDLVLASAGILLTNTVVAVGARVRLGADADLVPVQTVMLAAALAALYAGAVRRTTSINLADIRTREQQLRSLVTHSPALIARFDMEGRPLLVPDRQPVAGAVEDDRVVTALASNWAEMSDFSPGVVVDHEWELEGVDGEHALHTTAITEHDVDGTPTTVLTVTSDHTELRRARSAAEARDRLDAGTGLPNRLALVEQLESSATSAVVVVLVDRVDTTLAGLSSTDDGRVMIELAGRLVGLAGSDHYLARTAAHGFALVPARTDQVADLADAMLATVARPLPFGGGELYLTASAGIAVPGHLDDAETAARLAQDAGGGRAVSYEPSMAVEATRVRELITGLRRAVDRHELVVHFQPIVHLGDGSLLGAEALVRWQRPGHGLVTPDDFIGAAEQAGMIADIGSEVLRMVTAELSRAGPLPGPRPDAGTDAGIGSSGRFAVNVNVSAAELEQPGWPDRVLAAARELSQAGIDLEVELTETAVMDDPERACLVLEKVRAGGIRVVLDDFGTGFSTISWLHRLPVDSLKIDRSFVTHLPEDADCTRIVGVTVSLATQLGLSITAEGIETEAQRDELIGLGCLRGQGYLFDQPMPLADLQRRR